MGWGERSILTGTGHSAQKRVFTTSVNQQREKETDRQTDRQTEEEGKGETETQTD